MKADKEITQIEKAVESLRKKLDNLQKQIDNREYKFNNHSEKWQESEKGTDFNLRTEELQDMHYELEDKIETIECALGELSDLTQIT